MLRLLMLFGLLRVARMIRVGLVLRTEDGKRCDARGEGESEKQEK